MSGITAAPGEAMVTAAPARRKRWTRWLGRLGPNLVLILCGLFFLLPILTMVRYSFQAITTRSLRWENLFDRWTWKGLTSAVEHPEFWPSLWLSLRLAAGTVLLTILLVLPTVLLVHVRLPKARSFVEFLTLLPYLIPPIALVAGVAGFIRPHARWFLASNLSLIPFYAVLALPFTFRALDAGVRAIDVRTLIDASRSLGGGWLRTFFRVLVPNMSSAVISASFLTATVVLGEFTIAQTLLKRTYPQFLGVIYQSQGQGATALSTVTLFATVAVFALLTVLTRRRGASAPAMF